MFKSATITIFLVLALVVGAWLYLARSQRPPDLILITIDTLRADHMGLYGYERETTPNIDAWFARGMVFDQSYATESSTSPSVISLLSGFYPQEHRVRFHYQLVPEETELLPELLPPEYQSAGFVSNIVLTDEAMGISSRFDHYDDFVDEQEPQRPIFERSAGRTTDAVLQWLASRRDPERPLFLWVHYIDPHGPYRPPEDWEHTFVHDQPTPIDINRIPHWQQDPGVDDGLAYVDGYDEEIRYVDSEVGRLLKGLAAWIDIDRAFFVFTSDHGESMMEHEKWFTHSYHVYEEVARVPLMIRGPRVKATRRSDLVSGIDIPPTLLELAGAPPTKAHEMPGIDLLGEPAPPTRILFTAGTDGLTQQRAAIEGTRKWIAKVQKDRNISVRFAFDLGRDPKELRPLGWSDLIGEARSPAPEMLEDRIVTDPDPGGLPVEYAEGERLSGPKVAPGLDEETLEKLRSLGYVN